MLLPRQQAGSFMLLRRQQGGSFMQLRRQQGGSFMPLRRNHSGSTVEMGVHRFVPVLVLGVCADCMRGSICSDGGGSWCSHWLSLCFLV